MFQDKEAVARGALASYGVSYYGAGRISAEQVQRVLLGASPADLPVEQIDRLAFIINSKTAEALGLTIPPSVLARADEVIQGLRPAIGERHELEIRLHDRFPPLGGCRHRCAVRRQGAGTVRP